MSQKEALHGVQPRRRYRCEMHVEPRVFGWSLLHRRVLVHSQNRNKSKVRVRIEHVFDVVKRLRGFANARYRGITKNIIKSAMRSFLVLGLVNIHRRPRSLSDLGRR